MVRPGHVMENPVSGEDRIVFTKTAQQTGGELFELEVFIRAGAPGTPEMVHSLLPSGKQVAFSSMEFNRVVDGKVEEHWVEINLLGLVQQLGVASIPGPRLLVRILVRQVEKLRSRLSTER